MGAWASKQGENETQNGIRIKNESNFRLSVFTNNAGPLCIIGPNETKIAQHVQHLIHQSRTLTLFSQTTPSISTTILVSAKCLEEQTIIISDASFRQPIAATKVQRFVRKLQKQKHLEACYKIQKVFKTHHLRRSKAATKIQKLARMRLCYRSRSCYSCKHQLPGACFVKTSLCNHLICFTCIRQQVEDLINNQQGAPPLVSCACSEFLVPKDVERAVGLNERMTTYAQNCTRSFLHLIKRLDEMEKHGKICSATFKKAQIWHTKFCCHEFRVEQESSSWWTMTSPKIYNNSLNSIHIVDQNGNFVRSIDPLRTYEFPVLQKGRRTTRRRKKKLYLETNDHLFISHIPLDGGALTVRKPRLQLGKFDLVSSKIKNRAATFIQATARGFLCRRKTSCKVCLEDNVQFGFTVETTHQCRHRLCKSCAKSYVDHALDEGRLVIHCPLDDCNIPLSDSSLERMSQRPYVVSLRLELAKQKHQSYILQELQKDPSFSNFFLESNTLFCPVCFVPIQKNGGCSHMSCRCGSHFDWKSAVRVQDLKMDLKSNSLEMMKSHEN